MEQLYFEEVLDDIFIPNTCKVCKKACKILCLSKDAEVYCYNFKKE